MVRRFSAPAPSVELVAPMAADFRQVTALSRLTEVLAVAFSAADLEERRMLTTPETFLELDSYAATAGLPVAKMVELSFLAREEIARMVAEAGPEEPQLQYRRETSRLFYRPPRMAVLESRKWVSLKRRTAESQAMGERAAVAREYARQGLRVVPGAGEAEDCLQYELEFMNWILDGEAQALEAENTARVLELQELRREFFVHHLEDFCRGVAVFVEDHSEDPVLLFYARLLYLVGNRLAE